MSKPARAVDHDAAKTEELATRSDVAIAVWEALDCESVGAGELEQIQLVVHERFGAGAVESPAALARLLADEGAQLRHPEILEFDLVWREKKLSRAAALNLVFGTLAGATESLVAIEGRRVELSADQDEEGLRELREVVLKSKEDCLRVADSSLCSPRQRAEATEIAGWLGVWLRTPELFADWLDLRLSSPPFRKRFGQ